MDIFCPQTQPTPIINYTKTLQQPQELANSSLHWSIFIFLLLFKLFTSFQNIYFNFCTLKEKKRRIISLLTSMFKISTRMGWPSHFLRHDHIIYFLHVRIRMTLAFLVTTPCKFRLRWPSHHSLPHDHVIYSLINCNFNIL